MARLACAAAIACAAASEAAAAPVTLFAGYGGSVRVGFADGFAATVEAGAREVFDFAAGRSATLVARPATGFLFHRWVLPVKLECALGSAYATCHLGSVATATADACGLEAGLAAASSAMAVFAAVTNTVVVSAGAGGSVDVAVGPGSGPVVTVGASSAADFIVPSKRPVRLVARPSAGHRFASWSGACAGTDESCTLEGGPRSAMAAAAFESVVDGLTVLAGTGGSVVVAVGSSPDETVAAGSSRTFSFVLPAEESVALTAAPDALWRFSTWTLSVPGALECLPGTEPDVCELPAAALAAAGDSSAAAVFRATTLTLTLGTSLGGHFDLNVSGTGRRNPFPPGSHAAVTVTVTITAEDGLRFWKVARNGWRFAGWTPSGGLDCAVRSAYFDCTLRADAIAGGAPLGLSAAFDLVEYALTVTSGSGGSVRVTPVSGPGATVAAGSPPRAFAASAAAAPLLEARPGPGWRFAGWDLSGPGPQGQGLECREVARGPSCSPRHDPHSGLGLIGDATATATFEAVVESLTVTSGAGGSVAVAAGPGPGETVAAGSGRTFSFTLPADGSVRLTAAPDALWRFSTWTLSVPGPLECLPGTEPDVCELPAAALAAAGDSPVAAVFEATTPTLTLGTSLGGYFWVNVSETGWRNPFPQGIHAAGTGTVTVTAADSLRFLGTTRNGWRFAGWTWSDGLNCRFWGAYLRCTLRAEAIAGGAPLGISAAFEPVERALTVTSGAGGSVAVAIGSSPGEVVAAGSSRTFSFTLPADGSVRLTAAPDALRRLSAWTLSGALECLPGTEPDVCELPAAALAATGDSSAAAVFEATTLTLTLGTSLGGYFKVNVSGTGWRNPFPRGSHAADTVTVTVTAEDGLRFWKVTRNGWRFAGWTPSGGLDCEVRPAYFDCTLRAGAIAGGAALGLSAAFEPVEYALTVTSGPGGSVAVAIGSSPDEAVAAGSSRTFSFTLPADGSVRLTAAPDALRRLSAWTLSGALECLPGTEPDACKLPAAALAAAGDSSAAAVFEATSHTLTMHTSFGGYFNINVSGTGWRHIFPHATNAADTVTVTVTADDGLRFWKVMRNGWRLAGWMPSDGLDCAVRSAYFDCTLRADAIADAAPLGLSATFDLIERALTVVSGPGGSVLVTPLSGPEETVAAGSPRDFAANAIAAPLLEARPGPGWRFAGWALSGPDAFGRDPLCSGAAEPPACQPRHEGFPGLFADATAAATFEAVVESLTVTSGAGGSVAVAIGSSPGEVVAAGSSRTFSFTLPADGSVRLTAAPDALWRFSGWTLSGTLECLPGTEPDVCELPAAALAAAGDSSAAAVFEATTHTLTMHTSFGGYFNINVSGTGWRHIFPHATNAADTVTVTVTADDGLRFWKVMRNGWRLAGWMPSDGLDCAVRSAYFDCTLRADAIADAAPLGLSATFDLIERALTVVSGPGGSVLVTPLSGPEETVAAGSPRDFAANAIAAPLLEARPGPGWRFAGWALSGPDAFGRDPLCSGAAEPPACQPRHEGFPGLFADATAAATFEAVVESLTVTSGAGGSVAVAIGSSPGEVVAAGSSRTFSFTLPADGSVRLTAAPDALRRLSAWTLSGTLECLPGTEPDVCELPAAALAATGDSSAAAVFEATTLTLTLGTSLGGYFKVNVSGTGWRNPFPRGSHAADTVTVTVTAEDGLRFWKVTRNGWRFAGWTPSGGLDCEVRPALDCSRPRASAASGVRAPAAMEPGAPCDGSTELECDASGSD